MDAAKKEKKDRAKPRPMAIDPTSPWLSVKEAAAYTRRGRRYLRKQVEAGKLRAAVVGGKREHLFRREWLDQFLEDLTMPVVVNLRRRA
jgi:excisionase family DNA binding protein